MPVQGVPDRHAADPAQSVVLPRRADVNGIDIAPIYETPLIRLTRWTCRERDTGATGERQQLWWVMGFVHEGAFAVRTPRGGALIDSLHAVVFHPFEPYTTSHPCGTGDHGSGLVLREDLFRELLARRHPRAAEDIRRLHPAALCPTAALRRQLDLLRAAESAEGLDPLAAEETAVALSAEIFDTATEAVPRAGVDATSARHRDLAENVKTHLGREFRRPLHLASIAAAVESTPAHLCRVFRKATGETIHRYLTRLRLRAALEPLLMGADDLSGLALDLGFSSHSHFTYAFRREFGCTPSRWRDAASRPPRARIR